MISVFLKSLLKGYCLCIWEKNILQLLCLWDTCGVSFQITLAVEFHWGLGFFLPWNVYFRLEIFKIFFSVVMLLELSKWSKNSLRDNNVFHCEPRAIHILNECGMVKDLKGRGPCLEKVSSPIHFVHNQPAQGPCSLQIEAPPRAADSLFIFLFSWDIHKIIVGVNRELVLMGST